MVSYGALLSSKGLFPNPGKKTGPFSSIYGGNRTHVYVMGGGPSPNSSPPCTGAAGETSMAEVLEHAQHAVGGLACLSWLASVVKGASLLDPVYRGILREFLATIVLVFRVSPGYIKPADFREVQTMLEAIYSGTALWSLPDSV